MYHIIFILFTLSNFVFANVDDDFCDINEKDGDCGSRSSSLNLRYIFYDVNPPEGFNLRRDVYLRMAIFANRLKENLNCYLVLPPWSHLYHWQSNDITGQTRLPWSTFFDVRSLQSFAPVMEMRDFFTTGIKVLDQVYVLQHFEDTFTSGNFKDRMKLEQCQEKMSYRRIGDVYEGYFWDYRNVTSKKVECLSYHGPAVKLADALKMSEARTIMFDHAEVSLHDRFGNKEYWDARKSMKFARHLIDEAESYQTKYLGWERELHASPWPNPIRNAEGGPYLAVHIRRKDFLYGHKNSVPTLDGAAMQIDRACERLGLETVFVATDAPEKEKRQLIKKLPRRKVFMYTPSEEVKKKWKDGGIAIIEQIICSNAMYFIGTHESTFSFTIREEREIMGFKPTTTFHRFCGDGEINCEQPTQRLIVH